MRRPVDRFRSWLIIAAACIVLRQQIAAKCRAEKPVNSSLNLDRDLLVVNEWLAAQRTSG